MWQLKSCSWHQICDTSFFFFTVSSIVNLLFIILLVASTSQSSYVSVNEMILCLRIYVLLAKVSQTVINVFVMFIPLNTGTIQ